MEENKPDPVSALEVDSDSRAPSAANDACENSGGYQPGGSCSSADPECSDHVDSCKEPAIAPPKETRKDRPGKIIDIPVLDKLRDVGYVAQSQELEDEHKATLDGVDSRVLEGLKAVRRERDESLQRARDERQYSLSEVLQRSRSEIQKANDDFHSAKAALRRRILRHA